MIYLPFTLAPVQIFWICAIFIAFSFVLIAWAVWKRNRLPYYSAARLLTKGETAFYHSLRKATPQQFSIIYKVRLGDVIRCSDRMWDLGFGKKISSQHIDFVIVDRRDARIKICIELDDKSHDQPRTIRRDFWKNRVLKKAGLPLMRVRARHKYDTGTLRWQLWANIRSRDESYIRDRRRRLG